MTEFPESPSATQPPVRELAEIPVVEVITRSAVMLMSAAAGRHPVVSQHPFPGWSEYPRAL
jgi:hypothetical protein